MAEDAAKMGSATDPLREALEAKLAEMELHDATSDSFDQGYMAAWREFREALAPAEPERDAKRAAFLAGYGTLPMREVEAWAGELGANDCRGLEDDDEPLMVSVAPRPGEAVDDEWHYTEERITADMRLRPAEPEAWEWRAGYGDWGTGPRPTQEEATIGCKTLRGLAPAWFERRRPGTAPGPWERVDPEPREEGER